MYSILHCLYFTFEPLSLRNSHVPDLNVNRLLLFLLMTFYDREEQNTLYYRFGGLHSWEYLQIDFGSI